MGSSAESSAGVRVVPTVAAPAHGLASEIPYVSVNQGILGAARLHGTMRRICLLLTVIALSIPAAATASDRAAGDGSLGLSAATGTVVVKGRGVIYGHFDSGTLMVLDYKPDDGTSVPAISNAKARVTRGTVVYTGSDVRFLLPSGRYTIELIATDVNASAVGKGSVVATGGGTPDDGTVTVNGGKPVDLSPVATSENFGTGKGP